MRRAWSLWLFGKLVAFGLAVGAVWTIHQLASSPEFEATRLLASGNDLVPAEEIVEALGIGRPNIFRLRTSPLAARLERLPAIQSATVRPSVSGNIQVNVIERKPVMVWESASQEVLTDAEGIALRTGTRDLPILHGNLGLIPIGGRVDLSAVQVIQAITPRLPDLGLEEARLEWDASQGVSVLTDQTRVILGSSDQIQAKLQAYVAIRRRLDDGRISTHLIDVRSLDRPYFR